MAAEDRLNQLIGVASLWGLRGAPHTLIFHLTNSAIICWPGRLAMSSFDRLFGWLPNSRREWIKFIVAVVLLWLLTIVAITELELVVVPDQWRLNLALAPSVAADDGCRI